MITHIQHDSVRPFEERVLRIDPALYRQLDHLSSPVFLTAYGTGRTGWNEITLDCDGEELSLTLSPQLSDDDLRRRLRTFYRLLLIYTQPENW